MFFFCSFEVIWIKKINPYLRVVTFILFLIFLSFFVCIDRLQRRSSKSRFGTLSRHSIFLMILF